MKKFVVALATGTLLFTSNSALLAHASSLDSFDFNNGNSTTITVDNDSFGSVEIVEDNAHERVAEYTEEQGTTVATYDKGNNILIIDSPSDGLTIIDLNEKSEQLLGQKSSDSSMSLISNSGFSTLSSTGSVKQNTYSNYEYTITFGKSEVWQLRRPKNGSMVNYYYKNVTRNSSNATNLNSFKKKVDLINDLEWKIIGQAVAGGGLGFIAFVLSVPTAGSASVTAGLASMGAFGTAMNNSLKLHAANRNAEIYYHRSK